MGLGDRVWGVQAEAACSAGVLFPFPARSVTWFSPCWVVAVLENVAEMCRGTISGFTAALVPAAPSATKAGQGPLHPMLKGRGVGSCTPQAGFALGQGDAIPGGITVTLGCPKVAATC